ncbi:MAG: CPBP family intramembrane metalloprotease [Acidobacteria bacterium]|nr:CPBP family intramembrane metalloprotease [Acidobacteriota bacterium]
MQRRPSWLIALGTCLALVVINNIHWMLTSWPRYRSLHWRHAFYVAESIDKLAGIAVCIAVVWLLRRHARHMIAHEFALDQPVLPGLMFAMACSIPMLVGLAVTRHFSPSNTIGALVFLTVFSPMVEEIEYRAFGVRQLARGTRWPFWVAVWPSTLLFGWGHVEQGHSSQEKLAIFLITGTGGLILAWLLYRWQNLWFPIMLHIAMNLLWELFSVARTAVAGWFPFALEALTMLIAVVVTLSLAPPPGTRLSYGAQAK